MSSFPLEPGCLSSVPQCWLLLLPQLREGPVRGHGDTPADRHTHRLQYHLGPLLVPCPGLAVLSLCDDLILVLAIGM